MSKGTSSCALRLLCHMKQSIPSGDDQEIFLKKSTPQLEHSARCPTEKNSMLLNTSE